MLNPLAGNKLFSNRSDKKDLSEFKNVCAIMAVVDLIGSEYLKGIHSIKELRR